MLHCMRSLFVLTFMLIIVGCGPVANIEDSPLSERPRLLIELTYHEEGPMDGPIDSDTGRPVKVQKEGLVFVHLFPQFAPNTVHRVVSLILEGFYDNMRFHRIAYSDDTDKENGIDPFVVQIGHALCRANPGEEPHPFCGDNQNGASGKGAIVSEREHSANKYFKKGSLSMALKGAAEPDLSDPAAFAESGVCGDFDRGWYAANTADSQFFVCTGDCNHLNKCFTVFGEVVGGMSYLTKLEQDKDGIINIIYEE